MDEKTYKAMVKNMPSEHRMKLEQIKMFLSQGKASVMVGAGFSKNAHQMEFATMKDWGELSKVFFDQLFVGENKPDEKYLYESLKLAQMYECSFGRNALDAIIQSSLPNETTTPGKIHYDLMRLEWKDVFTTNYDTLLERAALETDRTYQVVTNKETLLYANSPRIIKLHGSFPNIRPYIITEEDFRTYPQRYPEFVNTVRQALMESLFCLIGFSGDDPNFLQWMGWLRDVMGNQMSPAYLITHEPHLHKAKIDLFKGRGIEIINMATISPGISYSDGLEFVMRFLSNESSKRWNPSIVFGKIETKEDVEEATQKMQVIREAYPHYLYLPKEYHKYFDRLLFRYGLNTSLLEQLSLSQRIHFLYEIVWRYEVSLSPITIPWIIGEMEALSFSKEKCDKADIHSLNDIRLSLLTFIRIFNISDHYTQLLKVLSEEPLTKEQKHRYYYEQCIHELGLLEYEKVEELLKKWDVDGTDIKSVLWKAVVLSEIGKENEAINLLNGTSQRLRQLLLTQSVDRQVMVTYSNALDEVLKLLESQSIVDTTLVELKSYLISKVTEAENKPSKVYESRHKFEIDQEQSTWHSDTNKQDLLLYGYKYLRLIELVGYPFGHTKYPINETWLRASVQAIMWHFKDYALNVLVRSRSKSATISCWNRTNVLSISSDWADKQYGLYKEKIETYINSQTYGAFGVRVSEVLLPAFAHIAPRMSMKNVEELGKQFLACYNVRKVGYDKALLATVQGCMSAECTMRHNKRLFSTNPEDSMSQLPWSGQWISQSAVADKDVNAMVEAVQQLGEKGNMRMFIRLWYMLNADLKDNQRKKLEVAIRTWRNKEHPQTMIPQILDTYKLVSYKRGVDEHRAKEYLEEVIKTVRERKVEKIGSTEEMNRLRIAITILIDYVSDLSVEQHEAVLSKVCQLLVNNEEVLQEDDSETFLGGLRGELQRLIIQFTKYIANAKLQKVNIQVLKDLQNVCWRYLDYGVASIAIAVRLNDYTRVLSVPAMYERLKKILLKGSYVEYSQGLQTIFITEDEMLRPRLLSTIIDYPNYAVNNRTKHFIHTIMGLIAKRKLNNKMWKVKINELLNRIADYVNDFEGDEEMRMDLMYYTNMLAGAACVQWGESPSISRWIDITKDNTNFNDVRVGFDLGQDNMINNNEELMSRLVME